LRGRRISKTKFLAKKSQGSKKAKSGESQYRLTVCLRTRGRPGGERTRGEKNGRRAKSYDSTYLQPGGVKSIKEMKAISMISAAA